MIDFSLYEHGSSAGPENLFCFIKLSMILFANIEYASAGKRITKKIEPSSCSTCILKQMFILISQYFRLTCGSTLFTFQYIDHGLQPAWLYFNIRIQQHVIIGVYFLQCLVITFCKAMIFLQNNELYL